MDQSLITSGARLTVCALGGAFLLFAIAIQRLVTEPGRRQVIRALGVFSAGSLFSMGTHYVDRGSTLEIGLISASALMILLGLYLLIGAPGSSASGQQGEGESHD